MSGWRRQPYYAAGVGKVNIARDLQLLIAAVAVIAGVGGALILPNIWLRIAALAIGLLIAAYVTGVLQQFLTSLGMSL